MSVLSVKNLSKKFGDFIAVNDISFEVTKNHVIGFLGPNGAGKTTTMRMLVGLSKPTSGDITIFDKNVNFGDFKTRTELGYLPEQPSLYPWMTGFEYLEFFADIFHIPATIKDNKIDSLLETVALSEFKKKKIGTYSNGMKQRIGIAQALINDPKLVILDEPVSALDPIGRKEILKLITNLKKHSTVLFSTHILSDVDKVCDDVVLMNHGKVIVSSPLIDLKSSYTSQILEVEFNQSPEKFINELEQLNWVKRVEQEVNHVRIWVNGEETLKNNLPLKYFALHDIGIVKYGISSPETEDLFIELLKKDNE